MLSLVALVASVVALGHAKSITEDPYVHTFLGHRSHKV